MTWLSSVLFSIIGGLCILCNIIADEVDINNEDKIDSNDIKANALIKFKRTFILGYDSDNSGSDTEYESDGQGPKYYNTSFLMAIDSDEEDMRERLNSIKDETDDLDNENDDERER